MLYTYSVYVYIDVVCVQNLDDECYISGHVLHIWTMEVTYLGGCYISGRWRLHIWTGVTYLDDGGYISGRVLHIWTMEVTYLDGCYISGRWRLHIWTSVTYLDDGGYISGRVLRIWTMEVTYLDECYISGRWRLHIWTSVTYLDDGGYISGRVLHIWTMEVTYLEGCYISEWLHICTPHVRPNVCTWYTWSQIVRWNPDDIKSTQIWALWTQIYKCRDFFHVSVFNHFIDI